MHRSGRTARALKEGLSVMLIGPEDQQNYKKIVKTLNRGEFAIGQIVFDLKNTSWKAITTTVTFILTNCFYLDDHLPVFPTEVDYLAGIKPRVMLARHIDKEEHKLVNEITTPTPPIPNSCLLINNH